LGLVAYLALEGSTTRTRLASLFWSENDEDSARRNLRRELHRLRETLLRDYVHIGEMTLHLHTYQTDVAQFRGLLEQGKVGAALAVYQGSLLEELELPGATGFSEWLERQREELSRLWQQALLYQAETLETRGQWREALEIHHKLLAQDSLQERHQREVMRLHYLLGEREAAQQYAPEQITTLCIDLAYPLLQQGLTEQARQKVEQALRLTQPWQRDHALALNALARLELAANRPAPAQQSLSQALEIAYRLQDETLAFAFLTNLLRVQLETGALGEARICLLEAETRFKEAHPRTHSTLKRRLAEVEYQSGHLGAALEALKTAIEMADALGERDQQVSLRALQATWLGYLGALPEAWQVCAALEQLQPDSLQLDCARALLHLLEDNLAAAQALLEPLHTPSHSLPETQATVCCYLGLVANAQSQPEKALALAQIHYPSGALQTLNLAVRLEATRQLGQPLDSLLEEARIHLASGKAPPLEGLELWRTLALAHQSGDQPENLRQAVWQNVQELAATLGGFPRLQQTFLHRQRNRLK
jgi:tetratricopeptide (TPR) repeat protein